MRIVLALLLGISSIASAQSIEERGRQVIDDAIRALGGDAFLSLDNKVEQGRVYSFQRRQVSGLAKATIYTRYEAPPAEPDRDRPYFTERQAFGDEERWYYLYTPEDAYEVTYRGARPMDEETVERVQGRRLRDIFYILLRRLNEPGMIFEYRGTEIIDNRPTVKVDITDSSNRVVSVWFQDADKLPIRQEYQWRDRQRVPHRMLTIYDKYRAVGGVTLPYIVQRYQDDERVFALFANEVVINQTGIDDKLELPGAVKLLERER